ncbi:hypothetical protein EJ04DRAFT_517592 [Polyplosphaeria fusca]|uniref:Uncharacterized protein n=1 Tax=Polyplosphaeria fusca TaxID=682080 RepID=A0A9P4QJI8_9PLEO|nr:hypothetical protein EJ04DRAFT_517592 [Polyplosphaeria fusca]
MFEHFVPRHIPPLLLATTITIGGFTPFFAGPTNAIKAFGLPDRIANSKAAHPLIITQSARVSATGMALWALYLGNHFEAMDIVLASMALMGLVDGYVCVQEGVPGKAVFRASTGVLVGVWGFLGMTAGRR